MLEWERKASSRAPISKDQLIGCFGGRATLFELDEDGPITDPRWNHREIIQLCRIGTLLLALTPVDDFDRIDYLNHSCRPNARILKGVVLVAIQAMDENEPITSTIGMSTMSWKTRNAGATRQASSFDTPLDLVAAVKKRVLFIAEPDDIRPRR